MRNRWLVVVAVASLCLNVAVLGAYFYRRARRERPRRFPLRALTPEVRERLRQTREAAMPEFSALAEKVQLDDSLLWAEMTRDNPESLRVDSLAGEAGRLHARMRAMVFWQMHRELQLMPASARAAYLSRMKTMRPGLGGPGRGIGRGMHRGPARPHEEPNHEELPPGPPPESGD
jgi:hypothetical protein